jgi:DNA-binding HxlR family transcriptional regulator
MDNPKYLKTLLNVLKNPTRLRILQLIANGKYSVNQLQQELKKTRHKYSQATIADECLQPLLTVGLAAEAREKYYATTFGGRVAQLFEGVSEFAEKLPANSEGYEETLLQALLPGPKTFQGIQLFISPKVSSRIIKRLRLVGLIETTSDRDYVFFVKSKRDPEKETFTCVERKIYDAISYTGISAGKLSKETGLSIRRIYEYLRHLRGKKLVFTRKAPRVYGLTNMGRKVAIVIQELQQIVEDTWKSTEQVTKNKSGGGTYNARLH